MSRVVIVAIGTRGDVAPLTGVARRLHDAGHEVVIAAHELFAELITGCGLRFLQMKADLAIDTGGPQVNPVKLLKAIYAPSGMKAIGQGMLAALRDEPADVLLLSPLAEFAGHQLAEAKGIPSLGVRLQPLSATGDYPPHRSGAWSAGSLGNRLVGRVSADLVDLLYARTIAGFRAELSLPKASAGVLRRRRTRSGWHILYGYSPTIVRRPDDWPPGLGVTGYWWPALATSWQPPPELTRFLDAGPPPVFIGFGSLIAGREQAVRMSQLVLQALCAAGARGVIQAGWAGLHVHADHVLTIGEVPHEWLFPRVAAVAHACGAGTTAAGLRAGAPTVAVPFGAGDQPFWAQRLRQLGVSAATIPQRGLTTNNLTAAIRTVLTDTTLRDNAQRLATRISHEDGAHQVLATVEDLTRRRRVGRRPRRRRPRGAGHPRAPRPSADDGRAGVHLSFPCGHHQPGACVKMATGACSLRIGAVSEAGRTISPAPSVTWRIFAATRGPAGRRQWRCLRGVGWRARKMVAGPGRDRRAAGAHGNGDQSDASSAGEGAARDRQRGAG